MEKISTTFLRHSQEERVLLRFRHTWKNSITVGAGKYTSQDGIIGSLGNGLDDLGFDSW